MNIKFFLFWWTFQTGVSDYCLSDSLVPPLSIVWGKVVFFTDIKYAASELEGASFHEAQTIRLGAGFIQLGDAKFSGSKCRNGTAHSSLDASENVVIALP